MRRVEVGELVYIPTEAVIKKIDVNTVKECRSIKEPVNALVVESKESEHLVIYYEGEKWHVKRRDAYRIKEHE